MAQCASADFPNTLARCPREATQKDHLGLGVCDEHAPPLRSRCIDCDTAWADYPNKLCPGCEAYREHTGTI